MRISITRWLRRLALASLGLTGACGGGGHGVPTGPGGGDGGDGLTGDYGLARIGLLELPADLTFEGGCDPVRMTGGELRMNDDGTWAFTLAIQDETGADEFDDSGQYQQNGNTMSFQSEDYGDSFQGALDDGVLKLDYDWCPDGQSDIQLVFAR